MKIAIMQPYFFPYIGYWQLVSSVDLFVVYDIGKFRPYGWINRNRIKVNEQPCYISIPVHRSPNLLIKNELIVERQHFQKKLIKTLQSAYGKAPYFHQCMDAISDGIGTQTDNLTEYLVENMLKIVAYLDIQTKMVLASELPIQYAESAQQRGIAICNFFEADTYINAIGGMSLYSKDFFEENDITLKFIKNQSGEYQQGKGEYIADLSIIDVMMYNSKEEIQKMLKQYALI